MTIHGGLFVGRCAADGELEHGAPLDFVIFVDFLAAGTWA